MNPTLNLKDKCTQLKQWLIKYLLIRNSIGSLSNHLRKFYILSIGFNDIYYRIKNPQRLKLSIFFTMIMWINVLWHFIVMIIPDFRSFFDHSFFPEYAKTLNFLLAFALTLDTTVKTDLLIGEINGHIYALKVFYMLTVNSKLWHQLTDNNYKRMTIISRIVVTVILDYGGPLFIVLIPLSALTIAIISKRLVVWINLIVLLTPYVISIISIATGCCICSIYFPYYKFRFDQLNDEIKSIIPNGRGRVINKRRGKLIQQLINQHNLLSLEIDKFNLLLRRSAAMMFIVCALIKIITLYLTIYMKHTLIRILVGNAFIIFFIFGFGVSILFSLQINSAKNNYKFIHSVVCNYKMKLKLRFKVIKINFKIFS